MRLKLRSETLKKRYEHTVQDHYKTQTMINGVADWLQFYHTESQQDWRSPSKANHQTISNVIFIKASER